MVVLRPGFNQVAIFARFHHERQSCVRKCRDRSIRIDKPPVLSWTNISQANTVSLSQTMGVAGLDTARAIHCSWQLVSTFTIYVDSHKHVPYTSVVCMSHTRNMTVLSTVRATHSNVEGENATYLLLLETISYTLLSPSQLVRSCIGFSAVPADTLHNYNIYHYLLCHLIFNSVIYISTSTNQSTEWKEIGIKTSDIRELVSELRKVSMETLRMINLILNFRQMCEKCGGSCSNLSEQHDRKDGALEEVIQAKSTGIDTQMLNQLIATRVAEALAAAAVTHAASTSRREPPRNQLFPEQDMQLQGIPCSHA
ncbi:hypothetical protein Tco_1245068 [Tanacetum coccineum]